MVMGWVQALAAMLPISANDARPKDFECLNLRGGVKQAKQLKLQTTILPLSDAATRSRSAPSIRVSI
jgi:hypothetical protein